jgi:hypothetical protein
MTWPFVAALAALFMTAAAAAPRVPESDSTVLEKLPSRPNDPAMVELREMRAALAKSPNDSSAAARLALRYFRLASAQGDPRYVGYAEAALQPWRGTDAPVEVMFARGVLRQYRHDFEGALKDLGRVVQLHPDHEEARSWRAAIFMVQADYDAAARECAALARGAEELVAVGCGAQLGGLTGKSREAYARLAEGLERNPQADRAIRLWVLTRLGELARRLEDAAGAERHFRQALALGLTDNYLLAAYSDFLLEQGRHRDVVRLLENWVRSDTLLLRLALAGRALDLPAAKAHEQALADRFAAAALRGERLHMGEEARFLLELKGDPRAALAVAAENWKSQREPRDAAVFLEAAAATRDSKAAAPVLRWLQESGFESRRLQSLAASLR